ncbi:MAG: MotA/TolQ/ExbB proton channel family protein [Planctomycetes bacterium]|nr:MotA/TolQ/ExbB proton channel family protein [Planctomycetota bacterium]
MRRNFLHPVLSSHPALLQTAEPYPRALAVALCDECAPISPSPLFTPDPSRPRSPSSMLSTQVPFVRLIAVAAPLLLAGSALAQEPTEQRSAIADVFAYENAGLVGYLIIVLSIVALALIIENMMSIKREKLAPPDLIDELEALFDGQQFQDAVELCEQDKNYLTNVVGAGLSKLGHSFETMQTSLREMQTEESVKLFQKIGWLSLISAIAPMMGLFGTVTGMFVTFGNIAASGGSPNPAQLAGGIKMALITTIFGLTVAIPVGVAFYALRNRVIKTSTEINAITEDLFERFRGKS